MAAFAAFTMKEGAVKARTVRLPVYRSTSLDHGTLFIRTWTRIIGFANPYGRLPAARVGPWITLRLHILLFLAVGAIVPAGHVVVIKAIR